MRQTGRVTTETGTNVLDDLEWRGLVAHSTDRDALRAALGEGSVRFYVGFDPTAPSLHMGNLVQLTTARRLQDAGHTPYILVGGATGMIGDPKESGERVMNSVETVKDWTERVRRQVAPFVSLEGPNAATLVNNYDWTEHMSVIDFLRDVGKHFPVNRMLARDVVRSRLEDGISYTEFSYVLLQSMDFLNLYREHGVTLQFGGSDQWGNITGGAELIRRSDGGKAHAFATPLITKADGTKYGKTEARRPLARPRDDVALRLLPVLAQRRRRPGRAPAAGLHLPLPRARSRSSSGRRRRSRSCARGRRRWPRPSRRSSTGPRRPSASRPPSAALFGGGDLRELGAATLAAALREAGSVRVPPGTRHRRPAGRVRPGQEQG